MSAWDWVTVTTKWGKVEMAKMAFERALQLDNKCVCALVGRGGH